MKIMTMKNVNLRPRQGWIMFSKLDGKTAHPSLQTCCSMIIIKNGTPHTQVIKLGKMLNKGVFLINCVKHT